MSWEVPRLPFLERVIRYLHEEGFDTGIYVNKKTGWSTINVPKQYAKKFGVKEGEAKRHRLSGRVIEDADQLKILLDNRFFDGAPVLVFKLVEEKK